jgi:hypothetical protein
MDKADKRCGLMAPGFLYESIRSELGGIRTRDVKKSHAERPCIDCKLLIKLKVGSGMRIALQYCPVSACGDTTESRPVAAGAAVELFPEAAA